MNIGMYFPDRRKKIEEMDSWILKPLLSNIRESPLERDIPVQKESPLSHSPVFIII